MEPAQEKRSILEEMQISLGELARRVGMASDSVSRVLSGKSTSKRARAKIEAALGEPIWCTWVEFLARGNIAPVLGGEPDILTGRQLRDRARKGGAFGRMLALAALRRFGNKRRPDGKLLLPRRLQKLIAGAADHVPGKERKADWVEAILKSQPKTSPTTSAAMADLMAGRPIHKCAACGQLYRLDRKRESCEGCRSVRIRIVTQANPRGFSIRPRKARAEHPQAPEL